MVNEHKLNMLDFTAGVQLVQRRITATDQDADDIPQPGQLNQHVGDSSESRVQLQTEVPLATSATHGITKQNGRVADIGTQLDHRMRLDFCDQVGDHLALFDTDVHEEVLLFELVDQINDLLGVALDFIQVGLAVDEVEELQLPSIIVLSFVS